MGSGTTGSSFIRVRVPRSKSGEHIAESCFKFDFFFPSCQRSRESGTVPCRDGGWCPDRAIEGVVPMAERVLFEFIPPYR